MGMRFKVASIHSVIGRGTVAAGVIEDGELRCPMKVQWHAPDGQLHIATVQSADRMSGMKGLAGLFIQGAEERPDGRGHADLRCGTRFPQLSKARSALKSSVV